MCREAHGAVERMEPSTAAKRGAAKAKKRGRREHETFVGFGNFHGQMKKEKELRSLLLNEKRKGRKEYDTFVGFLMSKKIP